MFENLVTTVAWTECVPN